MRRTPHPARRRARPRPWGALVPLSFALLGGPALALAAAAPPPHGSVWDPPPTPPVPYYGPGDTVPQGASAPHGGAPTPNSGAPGSPPPALSRPAAPAASGAATRPGAAASRPSAAPGANSGAALPDAFDLSSWSWWWEFNKEPYLALRERQNESRATSGQDGYFLGAGWRHGPEAGERISEELLRQVLLPAILGALERSGSNDVTTASLIALARIGQDHSSADRNELRDVIQPFLADANQEVAETAAAALGILGSESSALLLSDLVLDTEAGRRAVGRSRSVSDRTRAFAGYSMGLVGAQTSMEDVRRYVVHKLVRALESDDTATPDLGVACVSAIGRVPLFWSESGESQGDAKNEPASASREAQIRALLRVLLDRKAHRTVRAHVPTALAVLLHDAARSPDENAGAMRREVLDVLLEIFPEKRRAPVELRQSCAIAFGGLAECGPSREDEAVREVLLDPGGARSVRRFALLSLGRIAGRAEISEQSTAAPLRSYLLETLARKGNDLGHWAAIALALEERGQRERGRPRSDDVRAALRERLADSTSPEAAGALSIACGLAGDASVSELLLERLERAGDEQARGYAALALGLVQARDAVDRIRAVVDDATYRPLLLRESAVALGMLGDHQVLRLLTTKLESSRSIAAQAGIAQAIGRIGDASAVPALVALAEDQDQGERTRAFAIVALGLLGDRDLLPWNTLLSAHTNYAAAPATLYDGSGFGILNIL